MDSMLYIFLPVAFCLLCDHGLDFDTSLCDNAINQLRGVIMVWVGVIKLLRARGSIYCNLHRPCSHTTQSEAKVNCVDNCPKHTHKAPIRP